MLKKYIYALNLLDILKTQTIDASFAVRYILNNNFQMLKEEEAITVNTVLFYQPHISRIELMNEQFLYDSDYDSIEDFETVSCAK